MELIFATHNQHKLDEVQQMLKKMELVSLADINFQHEIVEDGNTFVKNATIKAQTIYEITQKSVFADDSGLVIDALDGRPGVDSAHYSGSRNSQENLQLVLKEMQGKTNRNARFVAVICLILNGETHYFEGTVEGEILETPTGKDGFGYDPIFKPQGYSQSFAEMNMETKNQLSHRANAIQKMKAFLEGVK